MSSKHQLLLLLCLFAAILPRSHGDVGTAASYGPPFSPTACKGNDRSQFPSNNLFGAATEGLWANGASCGKQYKLRCISPAGLGTCKTDPILIRIVDRAQSISSTPSSRDTTFVLSNTAFAAIADPAAPSVTIEYIEV